MITISIDPKETPGLAAGRRLSYLARYGRPGAEKGWHFLTGDQASIRELAKVVGFRYEWDAKNNQYAHAAGIMLVTPQGKLSRYIYGLSYLHVTCAGTDGCGDAEDRLADRPTASVVLPLRPKNRSI